MAQPKTILVIDDDRDSRAVLQTQLVGSGFRVIEAAEGTTVLTVAHQEHPDLIVLDLMMPKQDGIKTYQILRRDPQTKSLPIICCSALLQDATLTKHSLALFASTKHGIELDGDFTILGKPCETEVLVREVQLALAKATPPPTP